MRERVRKSQNIQKKEDNRGLFYIAAGFVVFREKVYVCCNYDAQTAYQNVIEKQR